MREFAAFKKLNIWPANVHLNIIKITLDSNYSFSIDLRIMKYGQIWIYSFLHVLETQSFLEFKGSSLANGKNSLD